MAKQIKKDYKRMDLQELLDELRSRFTVKPNEKMPTYMFTLNYNETGYWTVKIVDDWHNWMKKGCSEPPYMYATAERAIIAILEYIDYWKINVKKLQHKSRCKKC